MMRVLLLLTKNNYKHNYHFYFLLEVQSFSSVLPCKEINYLTFSQIFDIHKSSTISFN